MEPPPLDPLAVYLAISDRERAGSNPEQRALEAVRLGRGRTGATVLDLGAGQGWHSLAGASRFRMLGVDGSVRLVTEARRRARRLVPRARPRFLPGPSQALPLPDRSVLGDAMVPVAQAPEARGR